MKLSEHFSFDELTTTQLKAYQMQNRLRALPRLLTLRRVCLELLEPIRKQFGQPIQIGSGFRYPDLNARVGGSPTSQHMAGAAVDFRVVGVDDVVVLNWIRNKSGIKFGQLLLERGCLHISLPRGTRDGEVAVYTVATRTKVLLPA